MNSNKKPGNNAQPIAILMKSKS